MKGGTKKKAKKKGDEYATVKISRTTHDLLTANKEKNRTPIGAFIDLAVMEKIARLQDTL